ncbi:unnamed protein product [Caenorhabditis angaria]|uniref:Solute carrier family 25 member 46 n=1 Tax=Caenorhabditis angaria TaxID=860376 RepID=A0A9P1I5G0_9PELO|nr:unnamed protein product [Caenorhabditis angaria]
MPTQFIRNRSAFPHGTSSNIDDVHIYNDDFFSQQPMSSGGYEDSSNISPPIISGKSNNDPLAGALLGLADVITKTVISHPCSVIRRQCQVHQFANSLHLTPVTLVPVICNSVAKEGVLTFWKGAIGTSVLWGLANVSEIVIGDLLGLPRTYVVNGSSEKYWRHIFLKATTFAVMTPFYISSFIETVRSESGIGAEENKVLDVLVKGVDRMRYLISSGRDPSKKFSVIHLAIPTTGFQVLHYMIQTALYHTFFKMAKNYVSRKPPQEKTTFHDFAPQLFAQMSSTILTDLILYPIETILHRMYIQGTRTLIDNMDTGFSAVSQTVKYNGFVDCAKQIMENEGFWALYAGVGAVFLEYLLNSGLQQIVRACFDRGSEILRKATEGHPIGQITPPISAKSSFQGPLSGPFAQVSPIATPRKQTTTPPRDPTEFPTFGETVSQLNSPFHQGSNTTFGTSNRQNVFGSPPNRSRAIHPSMSPGPSGDTTNNALPPLRLNTDHDPFSG